MNRAPSLADKSECAICTAEILLRYCQKQLSTEEQLQFEKHLISSLSCWDRLISFNNQHKQPDIPTDTKNNSQGNVQNSTQNLASTGKDSTTKIADLMLAEYFIKKRRERIAKEGQSPLLFKHVANSASHLTDKELLNKIFPPQNINEVQVETEVSACWQEFFHRYESTLIDTINECYTHNYPGTKPPHSLIISAVDAVFKYLQNGNYRKLRELRDLPDVPIALFLKCTTYKALQDLPPFNSLSDKGQSFLYHALHSSKMQDAQIKLGHSKASYSKLGPQTSRSSFINKKVLVAATLALIFALPLCGLLYRYYLVHRSSDAALSGSNLANEIPNHSPIDKPTRYDLFDQALDSFLQARMQRNSNQAETNLIEMERLAKEMEAKGDNFGKDLLVFYQQVPQEAAKDLYQARSLSTKIENTPPISNNKELTTELEEAIQIFDRYAAQIELARVKVVKAAILLRNGDLDNSQKMVNEGLAFSEKSAYRYLYLKYTLERSRFYLNNSEFNKATAICNEVIELAKQLETPKISLKPIVALSGIYYVLDRNEDCFQICQKGLQLANGFNNYMTIQLLQLGGVSAFNLGKAELSEKYLSEALSISEKQENLVMIAQSQMFIGIVSTAQNRLESAEKAFLKAFEAINRIDDPTVKAHMETSVTGYYARQQMLAGNANHALELYEKTLEMAKQLNINQYLMLSQLHKGRAEVLTSKGENKEAAVELQAAIALEKEAQAKSETTNSLLCFAVTCKSAFEQLNNLPH